MKKGLKGLFTASLAVVALGGLVACGGNEEPTPTPTPTQSETTKPTTEKPVFVGKDFEFKGEAGLKTIQFDEKGKPIMEQVSQNGKPVTKPDGTPVMAPKQVAEKYNVTLSGKKDNNAFKLELKSTESKASKTFEGTYEFVDGIGYTFTFKGSNEVVRSKYDKDTKSHVVFYEAGLGDLGQGGEITLSLVDESFKISEEMLFITSADFGYAWTSQEGIQTDDGVQKGIGFGMKFYPNGVVQFKNNHVKSLVQEGTYTYANGDFTVNLKDTDGSAITATSTHDANGLYKLEFNVTVGTTKLPVKLEWNSSYYGGHGLSTITQPMGSDFLTTLTFNNDGTFLLDGQPVNPIKGALAGMDLFRMFDRTGTWTYDSATKQYTIKYTDPAMMPGQTSVNYEFTSKFDEATGLFSMDFQIGVAKGTLTGTDFGKNFTAKHTA